MNENFDFPTYRVLCNINSQLHIHYIHIHNAEKCQEIQKKALHTEEDSISIMTQKWLYYYSW